MRKKARRVKDKGRGWKRRKRWPLERCGLLKMISSHSVSLPASLHAATLTSMILRADNPFWIFKRVFIEQLTMIQSPLYSLLDERLYIFPPLHTVDLSGFLSLKPSCEEFENFKRWYTAASQTLLQGTSVTLRLVVYTIPPKRFLASNDLITCYWKSGVIELQTHN